MVRRISEAQESTSLERLIFRQNDRALSPTGIDYLLALNTKLAQAGLMLSEQHNEVLNQFFNHLLQEKRPLTDANVSEYFSVIMQERQNQNNLGIARYGNPHFTNKPIHERLPHDQLQDHDMTRLLPKSVGSIEVLAALNCADNRSQEAINTEIKKALDNPLIQTICIPVGPGHWRGIYFTKPNTPEKKYTLELFDPMGAFGAQSIEEFSKNLFKHAGIPEDKIQIIRSAPKNPQHDSYACGDFVCAKTHQKIKELGAPARAYHQSLIDVYVKSGNLDNQLRHEIRNTSQRISSPVVSYPPTQFSSHQKNSVPRGDKGRQPLVNVSGEYDNEATKSLIHQREKIYALSEKARANLQSGKVLSDEELAAKLQAEELHNAGYRRGP